MQGQIIVKDLVQLWILTKLLSTSFLDKVYWIIM